VVASTGLAKLVAGTGGATPPGGDGGLATAASLGFGTSRVFEDSSGNIYVTTPGSVRKVIAGTGIIQTAAGNGQLSFPTGVVVDSAGNIFIADTGNNRVREVFASTGNIQTIAGNGVAALRRRWGTTQQC